MKSATPKRQQRPATQPQSKDPERLYFPPDIADDIGLSAASIRRLKRKGCPFHGRKTTIRRVRDFVAKEAGAFPSAREEKRCSKGSSSKEITRIARSTGESLTLRHGQASATSGRIKRGHAAIRFMADTT